MDWTTVLQALMAGGGAYMQNRAQSEALERQQQAIMQAQAEQDQLAQRRNAMVVESAGQFAVPQTQQQYEQVIAPQQQRLEGVARQAANATTSHPAGASGRYDTEMARRSADELQRAIAEASMVARSGGGQRLMFEQGLQGAQNASDVNDLGSLMAAQQRASRNQITNAGRVNPGQMFAGGMLQAAAPAIGRTGVR